MTTVLQFVCAAPSGIAIAQGTFLALINTGSRLQWLADDPEYVTQPFGPSIWQQHQTTPNLYWCDWSAIYDQLGNTGREQAGILVGTPGDPKLLTSAPLPGPDNIHMQLVDVADLVAAGYQAAPATVPVA